MQARPTHRYELPLWQRHEAVAGVDEVGRGCLAGPVVAASVVLDPDTVPDGLADSKVLSAAARERCAEAIHRLARAVSIVAIDHDTIDRINILQATYEAMHMAIDRLTIPVAHLLIDGNRFRPHPVPWTTIVGGDAQSVSIAAASIVAKVWRDRWMREQAHRQWPRYGFDRNVGYGTAEHRRALSEHGPCPIHRRTFLRRISLGPTAAETVLP